MRLGSQGLEDPLEEEWQPTQVFLPGKSRVQRSLADYNPWGGKESDTPKWMSTHAYTHIHTIGSKTEMHLIHCRSLIKIKYGNTYSLLKKNCFYVELLLCSCSVMSNSLPSHELQHASLPVLHYLLEFAQTHVIFWVILCRPLSQHQGLFQWVSSLHHVTKVLEFQLQYLSFQWIFRVYFL